jgi:hypothetical protein
MGIDIYVNDIYEANNKRYEKAFHDAVTKRDRISRVIDPDKAKEAQKEVSRLYDLMYSVGYLRESYHGGPYVTRFLVKEAFEAKSAKAKIKAAKLKERLPAAVLLAIYRDHTVYGEALKSPGELILDEKDGGTQITETLLGIFAPGGPVDQARSGQTEEEIVARITPEQRAAAETLIAKRDLPRCALDYVEFVEQCAAHEAEQGKPCTIWASY